MIHCYKRKHNIQYALVLQLAVAVAMVDKLPTV